MAPKTSHSCIQETPIALMKQTVNNIEKTVGNIDKTLTVFIEKAYDTFSTKEEYRANRIDIESLNKEVFEIRLLIAKWTGGGIIISGVITFILNKLF